MDIIKKMDESERDNRPKAIIYFDRLLWVAVIIAAIWLFYAKITIQVQCPVFALDNGQVKIVGKIPQTFGDCNKNVDLITKVKVLQATNISQAVTKPYDNYPQLNYT